MRRHEYRRLAILQTADANALEPARMHPRRRLGVSHINRVVAVDCQPARAAELPIFSDKLSILRQNLDSMVMAIGDDQPTSRIELDRMRRPELARAGSGL